MIRSLFPLFFFLLSLSPAYSQTYGGAGSQGAHTAPVLRYGSELLLGRSHAQGGETGSSRDIQDRERVVLRRYGAETMPPIQAGQIGQDARLNIQEPPRPQDPRLLSSQGGRGRSNPHIIPYGAERTVEGSGNQGAERPRLAAFPPRDPSTAPGASRATPLSESRGQAGRSNSSTSHRSSSPPSRSSSSSHIQRPASSTQPPVDAIQSQLPPGNRFSDTAHEGLPSQPMLSASTRAALDRLTPRQQETYREAIRDFIRSQPRRTLSDSEVRLLIEAAQSH